jgi:hypothetical protein
VPEEASVFAAVTETAELYVNDQIDLGGSYDEALQVRYDLVRQDDQWRIRAMSVQ